MMQEQISAQKLEVSLLRHACEDEARREKHPDKLYQLQEMARLYREIFDHLLLLEQIK
jgi:hypothetical protein